MREHPEETTGGCPRSAAVHRNSLGPGLPIHRGGCRDPSRSDRGDLGTTGRWREIAQDQSRTFVVGDRSHGDSGRGSVCHSGSDRGADLEIDRIAVIPIAAPDERPGWPPAAHRSVELDRVENRRHLGSRSGVGGAVLFRFRPDRSRGATRCRCGIDQPTRAGRRGIDTVVRAGVDARRGCAVELSPRTVARSVRSRADQRLGTGDGGETLGESAAPRYGADDRSRGVPATTSAVATTGAKGRIRG